MMDAIITIIIIVVVMLLGHYFLEHDEWRGW